MKNWMQLSFLNEIVATITQLEPQIALINGFATVKCRQIKNPIKSHSNHLIYYEKNISRTCLKHPNQLWLEWLFKQKKKKKKHLYVVEFFQLVIIFFIESFTALNHRQKVFKSEAEIYLWPYYNLSFGANSARTNYKVK